MNTHKKSKRDQPRRPGSVSKESNSAAVTTGPWHVEMFSRAGIESIVIVIIVAMLFRTFEAEGYVIPTGSMAPTLRGLHKDVTCGKCGIAYQVGASADVQAMRGRVTQGTCPNCGFRMAFDRRSPYHDAFSGDRIYVNKLAFQMREPRRYESIVFKYPGNPKQNYIKRLVGLPNETVRIYQGDVFAHGPDSDQFQITRKPAETLLEMLQLVHDTRYVPQEFIRYGYPDCWYAPEESAMRGGTAEGYWSRSEDRQEYRLNTGGRTELKWLHYRHLTPGDDDWSRLQQGRWSGDAKPSLITDFYAYNAGVYADSRPSGFHWVGDLCVECEVQVLEARGELLFDLVEGGRHHVCRIDLGSGQAELSIDGGTVAFQADNAPFLTAPTPVGGARSYAIRFANVDDQLLLWVDGRRIRFNEADELWDGTYAVTDRESVVPRWSSRDAGDLEPARIGGRDVNVVVSDIRLLRDVYYIAVDEATVGLYDYDLPIYSPHSFHGELTRLFQSPLDWRLTSVFAARQKTEFRLGADDFFPLGDNSPESKDARIWHHDAPPHSPRFVKRDLLVGRPFVIFWPHPWPAGTRLLPVVPNFRRFKVIR